MIFDIHKQIGESKLLVTVNVYILDRFHHARNGTKVRAIYKVDWTLNNICLNVQQRPIEFN